MCRDMSSALTDLRCLSLLCYRDTQQQEVGLSDETTRLWNIDLKAKSELPVNDTKWFWMCRNSHYVLTGGQEDTAHIYLFIKPQLKRISPHPVDWPINAWSTKAWPASSVWNKPSHWNNARCLLEACWGAAPVAVFSVLGLQVNIFIWSFGHV